MTIAVAPQSRGKILSWYDAYFRQNGRSRNDLLANPEVLYQAFAFDKSVIAALRNLGIDKEHATVLDVGCSRGGSLFNFLRFEFEPSNLFGVDIRDDMIQEAQRRYPNMHFSCQDGAHLSFENAYFDVVTESTMFVQLTDDDWAKRIAAEMLRVTKRGGYIMLIDWRYSKPLKKTYRGLSKRRIARLFDVGTQSEFCSVNRGALIPPVGRFLSKRASMFYFLVQTLCPFLVGQITAVLKRK